MRISNRSWILLVFSTATPITVISFRIATLEQRRAIAAATTSVVGPIAGILPDIVFMCGILCFTGFLISLLFDYLRSNRKTWLP